MPYLRSKISQTGNLIYEILYSVSVLGDTLSEILAPEFIRVELLDDINRLLGSPHVVPILRYLRERGTAGAGWKKLDRDVVGNSSTTAIRLKALTEIGWVKKDGTGRRAPYVVTERGLKALEYHELGQKELGGGG